MDNGLISIIVPVYNAQDTIGRCLKSLLAQTYNNVEIIVIDDGSVDDSRIIVTELGKVDDRVQYYYQKNKGVSAARNYGLTVANGQYIGFCDSDDWVEPTMYETLMKGIVKGSTEISIIQFYWEKEDGTTLMPFGNDGIKYLLTPEEALREINVGKLFLGQLWNKLFCREVIGNKKFNEKIHICEDVLFLYEVFPEANSISFCNTCLYHYLDNSNSAMNDRYNEKYWTRRDAYLEISSICNERGFESLLPYVYKSLLDGDLSIAIKMCVEGLLEKEHYKILKGDFKEFYDNGIKNCKWSRRFETALFVKSLLAFKLYIRLFKKKR